MSWKDRTVIAQRAELVRRYLEHDESLTRLAREFGVSRQIAYKWIARYRAEGMAGLSDRSRRPHTSPRQTDPAMVAKVLALAKAHPTWGGRKLHHRLHHVAGAGDGIPAPSTITKMLRLHGRLPSAPGAPRTFTRFEAAAPNDLWQLDFKGWYPLQHGGQIHPLTVLDDHSRFLVHLQGMQILTFDAVQTVLMACFARYGLPWAMLCDNGPPWGTSEPHAPTRFDVWLMQLGIQPIHGRPLHPQTQGKVERFHRTLASDVFAGVPYRDLAAAQGACDAFRHTYNLDRPHEALAHQPPISRYRASSRSYPVALTPPTYADDVTVRIVAHGGTIRYQGYVLRVGKAFAGQPVGVRTVGEEGQWEIVYYRYPIRTYDVRTLPTVTP